MSSGTNTTTSQNSPPPQFVAAYENAVTQAGDVASTPYQPYSGNLVAGMSPEQTSAINTVNGAQGVADPYINAASSDFNSATQPLWGGVQQFSPQGVSQYESPYTSQVVGATQAQFNSQNQQTAQNLTNNAIASGAYGGDRAAVAQGVAAGQEQQAQAPVIAGLENQGYTQALGEFNNQQQAQLGANEANSWLNSQAAFGMGNLGNEAQTTALQGASAQLQTGGLEQQFAQENLNVPYEQYIAQQAAPYQNTQWYSNIAEGLGGASGGTGSSTSSTTPSVIQDITGLGTLGLSFLRRGGVVPHPMHPAYRGGVAGNDNWPEHDEPVRARAYGGGVAGYAAGGSPVGVGGGAVSGSAISPELGGSIHVSMAPTAAGSPQPMLSFTPSLGGVGGTGPTSGLSAADQAYFANTAASESHAAPTIFQPNFVTPAASTAAAGNNTGHGIFGAPGSSGGVGGGGGHTTGSDSAAVASGGGSPAGQNSGTAAGENAAQGLNSSSPAGQNSGTPSGEGMGNVDSAAAAAASAAAAAAAAAAGTAPGSPGDPAGGEGGTPGWRGGVMGRAEGGDVPDQFADRIRDTGEATPGGEMSPAGAIGIMQVMPDTASQPGFGVSPSNGTSGDTVRLGRDYAKAMLKLYGGDQTLASAAYNAGPGRVDEWIKQYGDPRTGDISDADFRAKIPFQETQNYAGRMAAPSGGVAGATPTGGVAGGAPSGGGVGEPASPYAVNYTPPTGGDPNEVANIRSHARSLGLLAAGLGILGGKSLNGMSNIGEGALEGLKVYRGEEQRADALAEKQGEQANEGNYRKANLDLEAQKFSDAADDARTRLAETGRHNVAQEGVEGQRIGMESERLAQARELAMTPPEVRTFQAIQKMPPEQQAAYYNAEAVKKGMLPMYTADQFRQPASGAPTAPSGPTATPAPGTTPPGSAAPERPAGASGEQVQPQSGGTASPAVGTPSGRLTGDDFLQTLPPNIQPVIKAIAQGRQPLPGRITPQTEQLISLTAQYDPTFDATDYNKRNRTATDFSAGQSNKAVAAINTAMAHLDTLDQQFGKLNNGSFTPGNWIANQVEPLFGDSRVNNAMQARDAVANELRKVFATTGGGGLEELRSWQDRFPINGSPKQQHDAITGAIELMDGRMSALSDRYNQGMGTNHSSVDLLSPEARTSYEHLTGTSPRADQSRPQTYAAPGSGSQGVTPQQRPAMTLPPMQQRVPGQTYPTPRGPMLWQPDGWHPAPQGQP